MMEIAQSIQMANGSLPKADTVCVDNQSDVLQISMFMFWQPFDVLEEEQVSPLQDAYCQKISNWYKNIREGATVELNILAISFPYSDVIRNV